MAKLNNVRNLGVSVVSVPAEKIAFNGAEYVKTAEEVKPGDIIRINDDEGCEYLTDGAYYLVGRVDNAGDAHITDNDGDDFDTADLDEEFSVFAKVSAVPPPTSVTYREVRRKARVGERIRIVAKIDRRYDNGDEFVVARYDSDGDVRVDIPGCYGGAYVADREYVVLEPVAEQPTESPKDKRIPIGHYGKIIGNGEGRGAFDPHKFPLGEIVKITKHIPREDRVRADYIDGHDYWYVHNDDIVEVAEPSAQPIAKQPEPVRLTKRLTVGDYVKVTDASGHGNAKLGDIAKVVSADHDFASVRTADGRGIAMFAHRFTQASAEEIAAYDKAVAISAIKPGMYARITKYQYGAKEGATVTITDVAENGVNAYTPGGYGADYGCYEIVTAEEAAEFERVQAEERKWSAIGRKVGEFKAGDVVKVVRPDYTGVGTVEDVVRNPSPSAMVVGVRMFNGNYRGGKREEVTLIAPVESLFNSAI